MGTLTFPFTLTAGQPENVNQLNSNLAAIQTVLNGQVDATNLAAAAVTLAKMAADSVGAAQIVDGTVSATELASNAVTAVKILDANVTLAKLAANSVDASKIVDGSVTSAELADTAIHIGTFTKINVGLTMTNVPAGGSAVFNHGMGVTAALVLALPFGVGNPASPGAAFNYDIPNSTQFRLYNTGTAAAPGAAWLTVA